MPLMSITVSFIWCTWNIIPVGRKHLLGPNQASYCRHAVDPICMAIWICGPVLMFTDALTVPQ